MYTANLTASITLNKLGITLNGVKDLLSQNEYQWGVIGSRYPEALLLNHLDPIYPRLVKEGVRLQNLSHAIDSVRGGKFVFIDETPVIADNLMSDCDTFTVGGEFQTFEYAFGMPKDAPYNELVNKYIIKYREEGYMDELWTKWATRRPTCAGGVGTGITLSMDMLAGIFYMLFIGIAIAVMLTFIELIIASVRDCRKNKRLSLGKAIRIRFRLKMEDIANEWFGSWFSKTQTELNNGNAEVAAAPAPVVITNHVVSNGHCGLEFDEVPSCEIQIIKKADKELHKIMLHV